MSKAEKKIQCKSCGAEILAAAKICPSCGVKVKKPIFKKWWFWLVVAVVLIAAFSTGGDDAAKPASSSEPADKTEDTVQTAAPEIEYLVCDVTELFDALADNALKAEKTYNGQYVEITGHLGTIDSSGDYICLGADENDYDYLFQSVTCYVKSDDQLDTIMELSSNDVITIKGQITDVGEVLGYSLNIESITAN